jgi:hypothetical protein
MKPSGAPGICLNQVADHCSVDSMTRLVLGPFDSHPNGFGATRAEYVAAISRSQAYEWNDPANPIEKLHSRR